MNLLIWPLFSSAEAQIPDCLLSYQFGPEQHILIVEKSSQSLLVYSNYQAEPVERFTITTGKENGPKLEEGDMKTPEGIYFFRRTLAGDELPKVDDYGEKAFTLNYPNPIDRRESREGSGIWLHGAFDTSKISSPYNSRGCVVMHNGDLVKVSKYIYLNKTPICIYHKIRYDTIENIQKKRDRFINFLRQWKTNWENKNIDGYIKFYDEDFTANGMDLQGFRTYKKQLNRQYRFIKITLSDINIYSFKDYFVVMFHQLYISDKNHFYSKKIQYWRDFRNIAKIADEYNFQLPPINKFEVSKGNYISINQFRKNYRRQLQTSTVNLVPHAVTLNGISITGETVKISLHRGGEARDAHVKVVPVLRLEGGKNAPNTGTFYKTLAGIPLDGVAPLDYTKGIRLENRETTVVMKKGKDMKLRGLTLFLVNRQDQLDQIITYFVNK